MYVIEQHLGELGAVRQPVQIGSIEVMYSVFCICSEYVLNVVYSAETDLMK